MIHVLFASFIDYHIPDMSYFLCTWTFFMGYHRNRDRANHSGYGDVDVNTNANLVIKLR